MGDDTQNTGVAAVGGDAGAVAGDATMQSDAGVTNMADDTTAVPAAAEAPVATETVAAPEPMTETVEPAVEEPVAAAEAPVEAPAMGATTDDTNAAQ